MGLRTGPDTIALKPAQPPVATVGRQTRRSREKRPNPEARAPRFAAEAAPAPGPDPVRIAVLAMESLGRASMRASFTGTEVRVAVPDAATAAIFQAAIAETGRTRATDRLIRIVVD
jgi:hypothetical protein